jgi:hypothetical protein
MTTTPSLETWNESNQKYLHSCIEDIKTQLKKYIATLTDGSPVHLHLRDHLRGRPTITNPEWTEKFPSALETVCNLFCLSQFQRNLLILCAGAELDTEVGQLCAKIHGHVDSRYPTFGLALAALPMPHFDALMPSSTLRRFGLIVVSSIPSIPLTASPLRIEEQILHFLVGNYYTEMQFNGMMKLVNENHLQLIDSVESYKRLTDLILSFWQNTKIDINEHSVTVQLSGTDEISKLVIASNVCTRKQRLDPQKYFFTTELPPLRYISADQIPLKVDDYQKSFIEISSRESLLFGTGLYISAEKVVEPTTQKSIKQLMDVIPGIVFVGTREPWSFLNDSSISLEIKKPERQEQEKIWRSCLLKAPNYSPLAGGTSDLVATQISKVISQFNFDASTIKSAANEALALFSLDGNDLAKCLWEACRIITRPGLAELAQFIVTKEDMPDVVLPPQQMQVLSNIVLHVKQRDKVYREWGFETPSSRGLGITALFSGPSGTGKTMAAEFLANKLHLDLFRIDLSVIVDKYIGETEKKLRSLFDAAEDGGSILFFDEADALFGKRSEIRDSHDRYANIEVSYLLQRMENYRGLAILATNMKNAIDPAFMRRITLIVNFPFPNQNDRARIWTNIFPKETKTAGIDISRLAQLNIAGGSIRNIALNAAFLAAEAGSAVQMEHLIQAAQAEYTKLEQPLTQAEFGQDWLSFLAKKARDILSGDKKLKSI